jgi:DNA repair exonuclease SbcCD nuclease subunit
MTLVSNLSDLHIDFHLHQKDPNRIRPENIDVIFGRFLNKDPKVEVLIVPGDLGHYNKQSLKVLSLIAEVFNYKRVFCTLGNHDLYARTAKQSRERREYLENYKDPKGVVHILNGDVVTYKGIRYGGFPGWYDGTYLKSIGSERNLKSLWEMTMNDANYCHVDLVEKFLHEKEKAFSIYDKCDVIITHINPSNLIEHQLPEYRFDVTSAFYNWDGLKFLESTTAKYVFYGHSHGRFSYTYKGVNCILNSLGYPGEPSRPLTLELEF